MNKLPDSAETAEIDVFFFRTILMVLVLSTMVVGAVSVNLAINLDDSEAIVAVAELPLAGTSRALSP